MSDATDPAATTDPGRVAYDPITLRFRDPELEAAFERDVAREVLPQIRMGLVAGIGIWAIIAVILPLAGPIDPRLSFAVGAAGIVADLVALRLLRGQPSRSHVDLVNAANTAISVVGLFVLVFGAPEWVAYVIPGLMLSSTFTFVVLRLPPLLGLATSTVYVVAFLVLPLPRVSFLQTAFDLFLVVSVILLGAMASRLREQSARQRFLQQRTIEIQQTELAAEKAKSDSLLRNVLPARIAERLREDWSTLAEGFESATVLFADLVGFTALSERLGPRVTAQLLNDLVTRWDMLASEEQVEKIKTIGDAYMVVGGVPDPLPDHAVRVVRLGLAMQRATAECAADTGYPVTIRCGVHSGPVVAGVIGRTKFAYDLWGDTVNVASRLESSGIAGEVQASESTVRLLGGIFEIVPRGQVELKGKGLTEAFLVRERQP